MKRTRFKKKDKYITIILVIAFLVLFAGIFISSRIGNRLYARYVPLTRTAAQVSINISQAHLMFEEFLQGDTTISMNQIESKILHAKKLLETMSKAKKNGISSLVAPNNIKLNQVVDSSLSITNKFYFLTHERLTNKEIAKSGSIYDVTYDELHGQLFQQLNILRASTNKYIVQQLKFFNFVEIGLQILTILVFVYIIYSFRRYINQRNRHLSQIEESKKHLQQQNEEIQTQNEEIKTQNEDLEEVLEQLQASKLDLMESEERLKLSLSSTDQGIWDLNLVTGEINTTKELFTMIGYVEDEFEFNVEEWENLLHPGDREFAVKQLYQYIDGSIPSYTNEFRLKTKDGNYKWILSKGKVIEHDHKGNAKRIIGTHTDITDKKKGEIALKEAAEIFNSSQNGMYIYVLEDLYDDSTLLLVNANPASEKLTGMPLNNIIGKYIDENFPNLRADEIPRKFADVLRTQEPTEIETYQYSDDNISKSYFSIKVFPMPGQRVAVSFENITEKVLTRQQLKDSEEKYRRLFASAQDGIFLMKDYVFVDCNDYVMKLFECDYKDEILFNSPALFSPPKQPNGGDSKEMALEKMNKALEGHPQFFEWKHMTRNKKLLDTEVSLTKLTIKGEVHLLAIVRDITKRREMEAMLKDSESKYRLLAESSYDIIITHDLEGNITYANPSAIKFTGFPKNEILEKNIEDFIPLEEKNAYENRKRMRMLGQEEILNLEVNCIVKDGKEIPIEYTSVLIFKDHKPDSILITARDITERKKAELALKESQRKYKSIFFNTPMGILHYNKKGVITDCNENFVKIIGSSKKALVGLNMLKDLKDENIIEAVIKSLSTGHGFYEDYYQSVTANKKTPVRAMFEAIKDENGKTIGGVGLIEDITERKKTQDELKNSEAKLKETQRIAKIASFEYNFINRSYHFSGNFAEILCLETFDPNNFFDINIYLDVIHPDDKEKLQITYEKSFQQFDDFEFSFRIMDEKDNIRHINTINRYQLNKKGHPIRLISVIQDYTEQKLNEQLKTEIELAEETANIKQQFLANMSHEIRTPMTGIIGMIDFLLQTPLNKDQLEYIHTIKNSSKNLMSIVNDVLNLSKIEAGKLELYPKPFETRTMIRDIVNLYKFKANEKGLTFSYQYDETIPNYINADENRLKQVVSNLVSNAIKYTEKGSVILKMRKEEQIDPEEVSLLVEVIDTGKGISDKDKKKLFTKFSQLKHEQGTLEGIGLGLVICKELVELMDGEINVESRVGEGSRFWFRFKATIADAAEQELKEQEMPYKLKFNKLILLAEDKLVNQKVISLMLKDMGCDVLIAKDGEKALQLFDKHYYNTSDKLKKFDIILMDIQMPVMDGITAAKNLKKNYEKVPPIIGISANAMEGDAEKYIEQGLDDYISKPVTREMLFKKLYRYCKK